MFLNLFLIYVYHHVEIDRAKQVAVSTKNEEWFSHEHVGVKWVAIDEFGEIGHISVNQSYKEKVVTITTS